MGMHASAAAGKGHAERFMRAAREFGRVRDVNVTVMVQFDDVRVLVRIVQGAVTQVEPVLLPLATWDFSLKARNETWQALWQPMAAAGQHDILALAKSGELAIEGNLHPFMANLQYIKDLLVCVKDAAPAAVSHSASTAIGHSAVADGAGSASGGGARSAVAGGDRDIAADAITQPATMEPIEGRYVSFDIAGKRHRVYVESAGQGIPLVCLHTAGADNRQYRHMLCDPAVTDHFRVLAFDMPWHGKSYPPEGSYDAPYQLTTALYVETVLAFCDALALERPVLIGCSIGGRVVLNLANAHASRFRALIGVEAADYQQPWYDTAWLHRPDVHGGEVCAALVSGLVAPQSPKAYRDETLWQYKQGGPGIFKGDLHFYRQDSDLRGKLTGIDAARYPLYLLTGEYDYSCSPADTLRTARDIPGAKVTVMREVGHFPMSENPEQFRQYLLPVLQEIRQQ